MLIFLVREPKKIAKFSRSFFNYYFSSYLPIFFTRIFLNVFRSFQMVTRGCLYRKMECGGCGGQSSETLVDHCQLSNMANWDWYGKCAILGIYLKYACTFREGAYTWIGDGYATWRHTSHFERFEEVYASMEDAYASWKMRMLTCSGLDTRALVRVWAYSKSSLGLITQSCFWIDKSSIVIGIGDSGYWYVQNGVSTATNNLLLWNTKWGQLPSRIWLKLCADNMLWNKKK